MRRLGMNADDDNHNYKGRRLVWSGEAKALSNSQGKLEFCKELEIAKDAHKEGWKCGPDHRP
jgi:hypothetical protein